MIGVDAVPQGLLVDRALALLREGPVDAVALCAAAFALPGAPPVVADRLASALLGADPRVQRRADGRWGLVAAAAGSPLVEACAFAVVDCETTGMRATGDDRVTEVAVVLVQGDRREVVFESLVNPGRPIPPMIAAITGISDDLVRDAPAFSDIADPLRAALAGRVFVAHNARFDWGFLGAEFQRHAGLALEGPRLCTVRLARRLLRGVGSCGLDNLSRHLGIANDARHRATGDALATARLLEHLLGLARGAGVRTLDDLAGLAEGRRPAAPTPA